MQEIIGSALGWIGTAGTFAAYVLMLRGTWSPTTKRYLVLNTVGGFFAAAGALAYGAWPSMVSNVVWAAMGAYGLFVALRSEKSSRGSGAAPGVTAVLPLPLTAPSAWDPTSTAATAISLPWLPRSHGPNGGEDGRAAADPESRSADSAGASTALITDLEAWREADAAPLTA